MQGFQHAHQSAARTQNATPARRTQLRNLSAVLRPPLVPAGPQGETSLSRVWNQRTPGAPPVAA
eukprot:3403027-Alexandrium_andersonii.AAC.1